MAGNIDELEINPFYEALQTVHNEFYEKAQEKCHIICVPQTETLMKTEFDIDFVETHILRTSPFFKGQFITTHKDSKYKTLKITDDEQFLVTVDGFSEDNTVKILSEELAYNKEYVPYKILILDKPLNAKSNTNTRILPSQMNDIIRIFKPKIFIHDCEEFLKSFPELEESLEELDKDIVHFCGHYMALSDYLDDAIAKLSDISSVNFDRMSSRIRSSPSDVNLFETLAGAIESYVMDGTYHKIFPVIEEHLRKSDKVLSSKCEKLCGIRPDHLGVRREFSCPLPSAVSELSNLKDLCTPREKLACLKATVDNITEGITLSIGHSKQAQLEGIVVKEDEEHCLTSDDLIPILVAVIAQATFSNLHANLYYMEHFIWDSKDKDRDDLSYCLVSFKAAIQYMMTADFSHLESKMNRSSQKSKKLEDLMASASISRKHLDLSSKQTFSHSHDRLDRKLERISGVLKQTTTDFGMQKKDEAQLQSIFPERVMKSDLPGGPSSARKRSSDSGQLGDFLSALQDDDVSFGKQF